MHTGPFIARSLRPRLHVISLADPIYGTFSSKEGGSDGKEGGSDGNECAFSDQDKQYGFALKVA